MFDERHFGVGVHAAADLTILLEFAMGMGLLAGAVLARRGKFRLHAWCQSAIVVLNLALISLFMITSFQKQVIPQIPSGLSRFYYAIAILHAALGSLAQLFGLYIVLAAGTTLLPEKLRLQRYKPWMQSVLILWWVVLLLGFVTYLRWHWPKVFRKMIR